MKKQLLFRPLSIWIGVHHSKIFHRTCINLLPCITIRIDWHEDDLTIAYKYFKGEI